MPYTNVKVCLTDRDRSASSLLFRVAETLRKAGRPDLAQRFQDEAIRGDYNHVLQTARKYVVVE